MPGMPSTPSAVETGASAGSIFRTSLPSETAWVCQPFGLNTMSPAAKPSIVRRHDLADGAALHHLADARPAWRRTAHRSSARACRDRATATACAAASRPAPACGTGISSMRKSLSFGSPTGRAASTIRACRRPRSHPARVVRALAGDGHVVDVAFAQARRRDADELRLVMELVEVLGADIAHRGAQAAGELVQHGRRPGPCRPPGPRCLPARA